LSVEVTKGRQWEKPGRHGQLRFEDTISMYIGEDGSEVARGCWTKVWTKPGPVERRADSTPAGRPTVAPVEGASPERIHDRKAVCAGDRWTEVVAAELTLSQLVGYAGASGDYIGVHHDPELARMAGYETVIAHGMLTMALTARVVSSLVGTSAIRSLSGRMQGVVRVGDTLTTTAWADEVGGDSPSSVSFRLETATGDGAVVLVGRATAALPA
jgi:peroxisomal enoyl-CoA hydratase 2